MIKLSESIKILDNEFSKLIIEKIGDSKKDFFIQIDNKLEEIKNEDLLGLSKLGLGECEVDGIKAIKKLGAVYLTDKNLNFLDKMQRIHSVVPTLKYKNTSTLDYIKVLNQYDLILINDDNGNEYNLIIVSYVETL